MEPIRELNINSNKVISFLTQWKMSSTSDRPKYTYRKQFSYDSCEFLCAMKNLSQKSNYSLRLTFIDDTITQR